MGRQSREKQIRRLGQANPEAAESKGAYEFKTGLEKACLFIIKWMTYSMAFVPLFISPQFFFPFVAPKTTLFRILVEIIFAAYLILAVHKSSYRPKISYLTIALTVFLAVFILTSATGINFGRSFWSTYERMTGLFTMLHLYAFFIVLTSCFKKREDWEKLLGFSVLAGVFLSLYILKGNEISTRGGGTIGNTSFMAAYLLFDIFFAIILFLSNLFKKQGWPIFWQIFSGTSLLIILPVFFRSSARGAIASFWFGLSLMAIGYLIFSKNKLLKRAGWTLVLFSVVLIAVFLIFQPGPVEEKISLIMHDMKPRFAVWEIGYEAWKERPLLGWGPENFNVAFVKHFNPCLFLPDCGGEIWFDRAHNIVFDTLAANGIVGFVSYMAIFGVAIFSLIKVIPKITEKRNIFIPLGLGALLAAYFFQNFLVFDMINTYLMFFIALAFIAFLTTLKSDQSKPKIIKLGVWRVAPIIIFTILMIWLGNFQTVMAGHYLVKSLGAKTVSESDEFFQKSLASFMNKYEAREQFGQKLTQVLYGQSRGSASESFKKMFEWVAKEMENGIKENPLDFRPRLFLGKLYTVYYQFSEDAQYLILAENILKKAVELSPNNQQGYWYLGEVMLGQRKFDDSILFFKKAAELEPRYSQSYWYLVLAYKYAGRYQEASDTLSEIDFNWKSNLSNIGQVIDIYRNLGDDESLVSIYLEALKLDPRNAEILASLAASYANLGQLDKAVEAANEVKKIDPNSAAKVDEFLESIPVSPQ